MANILNHPSIKSRLESGEIDESTAEKLSQDIVSQKPDLVKSYGYYSPGKETNQQPKQVEGVVPAEEEALSDISNNERILKHPSILSRLKSGEIDQDKAVELSDTLRKNMPEKFDSAGYQTTPQDEANKPLSPPTAEQVAEEVSTLGYLWSEIKSGATLGVFGGDVEAPDMATGVAGLAVNMIASIPISVLGSLALGPIGTFGTFGKKAQKAQQAYKLLSMERKAGMAVLKAGKTLKAGAEVVGKGAVLKAGAKSMALGSSLAATEGAAAGAVAGAATGYIKGEDLSTILSRSVQESSNFAIAGAVMAPAFQGLGNVISSKSRRGQRALLGKKKFKGDETVQAIQEKGLPKGYKAQLKDLVDSGDATSKQEAAYEGLKKLEELGPHLDNNILPTDMPEVVGERIESMAKGHIDSMVKDPSGPLHILYKNNPHLQKLIADGNNVEALSSLNALALDTVGENRDIREFFALPYINNADTFYETIVDRFLKKNTKFAGKENLNQIFLTAAEESTHSKTAQFGKKRLIDKFGIDPLEAAEIHKGVKSVRGSVRRVMKESGRLYKDEVVSVIDKRIGSAFKALSSEGLSFDDVKNLADTNDVVRASIGLNRVFHKNMEESYNLIKQQDDYFTHRAADVSPEDVDAGRRIRGLIKTMSYKSTKIADLKKVLLSSPKDDNSSLKHEITELSGQLFRHKNEVDSLKLSLNNVGKEIGKDNYFQTVMGHVNESFMPGPKIMGDQYKNLSFKSADAPYVIKDQSFLADEILGMHVSGLDAGDWINKGSLLGKDRKLQKEFGYNNAITNAIMRPFRSAEANLKQDFMLYTKKIRDLKISASSKESELLHRLVEDKSFKAGAEFQALDAKTQEKILNGAEAFKGIYDDLLTRINTAMERNGLPTVNRREDYVTHIKDISENLPSLIARFKNGAIQEAAEGTKTVNFRGKIERVTGPGKTSFRFEIPRSGDEFTYDAIKSIDAYLGPALKRIHFTDLLKQTETAIDFAPLNLQKFLIDFKNDSILGLKSNLDERTPKFLKTALDVSRNKMARGMLLYNPNTMFVQILGSPMNFALGGMRGLTTAVKMAAKPKSMNKMYKHSNIKWIRDQFEGAVVKRDAIDEVVFNTIRQISPRAGKAAEGMYDNLAKVGQMGLEVFDKAAVQHAWISAHDVAVKGGLNFKQASVYADDVAMKLHASFSSIDQPEFMQNSIMRSLGQFQSFVMNLFTTIIQDIPHIASSDSGHKAVSMILKTAAGGMIANEAAKEVGMYEPFNVENMIPGLSSFRFGVPSFPFYTLPKYVASFGASDREYARELKNLERSLAAMALPGGRQLHKVVDALTDKEIKSGDKAKALMFGAGKVKWDKKKKKMEDKAKKRRAFGRKSKVKPSFTEKLERENEAQIKKRARVFKRAFK